MICALSVMCAVGLAHAQPDLNGQIEIRPLSLRSYKPLDYLAGRDQAQRLLAQSNWARAARLLTILTTAYPYDGAQWHDLGIARMHQSDYTGAAAAFEQAQRYGLGADADENAAYAARAFAGAGDDHDAIKWLRICINDLTYREPQELLAEPEFNRLRAKGLLSQVMNAHRLPAPASREAKLSADLDFYLNRYRRYRFRALSRTERAAILKAASHLRGRFTQLNDGEVVVEFQRLAALGHGGHNTTPSLANGSGFGTHHLLTLPIALYAFPEGEIGRAHV